MSTLLNQTMQKHLEIPVKKSIIANSEKKNSNGIPNGSTLRN